MTEILLARDLTDITPAALISRRIRLLTLDIENVLTDYGDPEVREDAASHVEDLMLSVNGLQIACITNKTDEGFVRKVSEQLPDGPGYFHAGLVYPKKPNPMMFRAALDMATVSPEHAMHVDDQGKSGLGAIRAGYRTFVWTEPYGEHDHRGVKLLRPIESVVKAMIATGQVLAK